MPAVFKNLPASLVRGVPTVLTLVALAGVAYLGHRTDWKIPSASKVLGTAEAPKDDWCMDHGVPESSCIICRGLDANAVPPTQQARDDYTPPPAAKPEAQGPGTVESGTKRPAVQLGSADTAARAGVTTAAAQVAPMVDAVTATAELTYDLTRYAQPAARVPGTAVLVRVKPGQKVATGDVLALIDSAEVGAAKAEVLAAAAQLAARRAALERIRASTEAGFRNQADLITAEAEANEAVIRVFNANQALRNLGLPAPTSKEGQVPAEQDVLLLGIPPEVAAELPPGRATANLIPITAPLDGRVVSVAVVPGQVVEAARPLLEIANTSTLWIHADVPLSEAGRLQVGQAVEFRPDIAGAVPVVGKVVFVSPEVSEATRMVRVRAEVDNTEGRLFAHTFGQARIMVGEHRSAVVVPESAVQRDGEAHLVFVQLNPEVFTAREVRLGTRKGGMVEVLSGVRAGEPVAVTSSYALVAHLNRGKLGAGCADD